LGAVRRGVTPLPSYPHRLPHRLQQAALDKTRSRREASEAFEVRGLPVPQIFPCCIDRCSPGIRLAPPPHVPGGPSLPLPCFECACTQCAGCVLLSLHGHTVTRWCPGQKIERALAEVESRQAAVVAKEVEVQMRALELGQRERALERTVGGGRPGSGRASGGSGDAAAAVGAGGHGGAAPGAVEEVDSDGGTAGGGGGRLYCTRFCGRFRT
jgi:hypothetical protein